MRKAVLDVIGVYLLSEQVMQLPLAVLQATSICAVDDPNQPVGLPTSRKNGMSVCMFSKQQLLPHRITSAYFLFFIFYVCFTITLRLRY